MFWVGQMIWQHHQNGPPTLVQATEQGDSVTQVVMAGYPREARRCQPPLSGWGPLKLWQRTQQLLGQTTQKFSKRQAEPRPQWKSGGHRHDRRESPIWRASTIRQNVINRFAWSFEFWFVPPPTGNRSGGAFCCERSAEINLQLLDFTPTAVVTFLS